jgi:hypothetical protein
MTTPKQNITNFLTKREKAGSKKRPQQRKASDPQRPYTGNVMDIDEYETRRNTLISQTIIEPDLMVGPNGQYLTVHAGDDLNDPNVKPFKDMYINELKMLRRQVNRPVWEEHDTMLYEAGI